MKLQPIDKPDEVNKRVGIDCDCNSKLVIVGSNTSETFDKVCLDLSMLLRFDFRTSYHC